MCVCVCVCVFMCVYMYVCATMYCAEDREDEDALEVDADNGLVESCTAEEGPDAAEGIFVECNSSDGDQEFKDCAEYWTNPFPFSPSFLY